MQTKIFYPRTRYFPTHPQILHQLTLQLFLSADRLEETLKEQPFGSGIIMPYGSYFDTGLMQAALHRYRLQAYKPERVVVIALAKLDTDITFLTCDYESLHAYFGELSTEYSLLQNLDHLTVDNELFAQHADPIVGQLPFLRSYHKIESITPLIINTKKTDLDREDLWSAIYDTAEKTGYIVCANGDETNTIFSHAEEDAQQWFQPDPDALQRTS